MKTKKCNKCGKNKKLSEFHKNKTHKYGVSSWCKECQNKYNREYYQEHFKEWKEYAKKYQIQNAERRKKYYKNYYKFNKKRITIYWKKYYKNKDNKERKKLYKKKNIERIKKVTNKWQREKYKNDPIFKLNRNMGINIWQMLKGKKNRRGWQELLGYSKYELMNHLKSTIPKGYIWNDYLKGELHLDHIIPKSLFNITSAKCKGFKKCWALENLRLLPKKENQEKFNKLFTQ